MEAKKFFNVEMLIETAMDKLFQLFEYVYQKSSFFVEGPAVVKTQSVPTIHFSNEEVVVSHQVTCDTTISTIKCEQTHPMVKVVEGELFV